MKLIVTDKGDPSVGIFETSWEIDAPLQSTEDSESLEFFRSEIIKLYKEFSEGKIIAEYDHELKFKDHEKEIN